MNGGAGRWRKFHGFADVGIPAAADHEEPLVVQTHSLERGAEFGEQDDVGVAVAEEIVTGNLLGAGKHVIEALGAEAVALHVRFMTQAQLLRDFGRAGVDAKQNHFDIRMKVFPTGQCVALDNAAVSGEGFCGGE